MALKPRAQFAWHVHHNILVEVLTGPLTRRREYIRRFKPASEVALRLRLLKRVRGQLPGPLVQAQAVLDQAQVAWDQARAAQEQAWAALVQAWAAQVQAWAAWVQALKDAEPELTMLHAKECPNCPWDGQTIFPK